MTGSRVSPRSFLGMFFASAPDGRCGRPQRPTAVGGAVQGPKTHSRMTGSSDSVTRTSLARLLVFVAGILACEGASTLTPPRTFVQPQRSSAFVKVALELRGGAAANRIQRGGGKKHVFKGGDASIGSSIFNLVNNVAGAGILALSAGQAAGTGYIPSLLICAGLGWLSARSFCMIGKACELTGEEDFKVGTPGHSVELSYRCSCSFCSCSGSLESCFW